MKENCGICKQPIFTKYQGYHLDGLGVYHMACELGHKPAYAPGFRWDGDASLMLPKHKQPVEDARLLRSVEGRKPNARPMAKESGL